MKLAAIILAAGNSHRFKSNTPKQFHFYKKDIILNHSIKKFEKIKEIKEIYIALNNKYQKKNTVRLLKKQKKLNFLMVEIIVVNQQKKVLKNISKLHTCINSRCSTSKLYYKTCFKIN